MNAQPPVVIILVNWNGKSDTLECLASLRHDRYSRKSIVVVDNGSTDGSAEAICKVFPEVKLIRVGRNLGFTGGNNVGIRHALDGGAEYVLLLNNDTEVEPGVIESLVGVAEANPDVGIVTAPIYYAKGDDRPWFAGCSLDMGNGHAIHRNDRSLPLKEAVELDWATGCLMLLRRRAIEECGAFDDRFFLNWEDVELSTRYRKAGYRILLVPAPRVFHKVGASIGRTSSVGLYYHTRNQWLLLRLHGSAAWRWAVARSVGSRIREVLRLGRRDRSEGVRGARILAAALTDHLRGRYGQREGLK